MNPTDGNAGSCADTRDLERRRQRALLFSFFTSLIGLPIGLALGLPIVWGLAFAGIIIAGSKLYRQRSRA